MAAARGGRELSARDAWPRRALGGGEILTGQEQQNHGDESGSGEALHEPPRFAGPQRPCQARPGRQDSKRGEGHEAYHQAGEERARSGRGGEVSLTMDGKTVGRRVRDEFSPQPHLPLESVLLRDRPTDTSYDFAKPGELGPGTRARAPDASALLARGRGRGCRESPTEVRLLQLLRGHPGDLPQGHRRRPGVRERALLVRVLDHFAHDFGEGWNLPAFQEAARVQHTDQALQPRIKKLGAVRG